MPLPFIILFLPLIAALVILLGTRRSGQTSAMVSVGSVLITLACAIAMLFGAGEAASLTWMTIGDLTLDIGIEIDSKTRSMMFIVTFIGALVHIFSLQYMKDDDAKARFFGGLSLFMFSMTGIVLADNFAMMFIFWELVGVSSYLLIGHWYQKNSAADAAKKAFLMNRIGDFGFMIGILILFGLTGSLSFSDINNGLEIAEGASESKQAGLLTLATLCIFCGAIGKSAQFPLHTWLPDAMEGPTPVSALIHAATMVAAGVYMLVKVSFLLYAAPLAAEVISYIGCITALIAALIATQQDDIKKVLAYSTLSQLGYMVMAVGFVGMGEFDKQGPDSNIFDPANAAYFHLYTHAFFKALLFLGSGAVIYACHHQQNIWKMGGLKQKMPITTGTFAIGTAALLGIPYITSGFFSKDSVLAATYSKPHVFIPALCTVFLTAFYMTRLFVVAFLGKAKSDDAEHAKEVPPIMFLPLVLLAVFSIAAGWSFVSKLFGFDSHHIPHPHGLLIPVLASLMGFAGIGIGFLIYRGKEKDPIRIPLLANKFGFDELYAGIVRIFQDTVAYVAKALDQILIDGLLVRGLGAITAGTGSLLRRLQVGNLQGYAFLFGLGVIAIIYFLIISV